MEEEEGLAVPPHFDLHEEKHPMTSGECSSK